MRIKGNNSQRVFRTGSGAQRTQEMFVCKTVDQAQQGTRKQGSRPPLYPVTENNEEINSQRQMSELQRSVLWRKKELSGWGEGLCPGGPPGGGGLGPGGGGGRNAKNCSEGAGRVRRKKEIPPHPRGLRLPSSPAHPQGWVSRPPHTGFPLPTPTEEIEGFRLSAHCSCDSKDNTLQVDINGEAPSLPPQH